MLRYCEILVHQGGTDHRIIARRGSLLREVLQSVGLSPYRGKFRAFHCHGLGICGRCRIGLKEPEGTSIRRSCQLRCFHDMEIELQ